MRLIWLALGIALGLIASAIPSFSKEDDAVFLKVYAPWDEVEANQPDDGQAPSIIEMAWRCGARDFSVVLPTHSDSVYIRFSAERLKVVNCILGNKTISRVEFSFVSEIE